ncbi:MAG: 1,6-anhydro-N-acetylmuramyl-L-alanine amidase AmpD [Candidatus Dadabacteria bacterium]|nr:MAG: 1,6-anhydro-N-acetylmuramyl-L-alanine amidase AmpD [Candidatus Dadabacteria bacterium]
MEIRILLSEFYNRRPEWAVIDTLVIHSMFNPFSEDLKYDPVANKELLDQYKVSAHYLIDREGVVWKLVDEGKRAWHAGVSKMPHSGRVDVNSFSIGIELLGSKEDELTQRQYQSLVILCKDIFTRYPIKNIVGHKDIAPERKDDPWNFNWRSFFNLAIEKGINLEGVYISELEEI